MAGDWEGKGEESQGDARCLRGNLPEDMYGRRGEGCVRCSFSRCMGIVGAERGAGKDGRKERERHMKGD